ncbi:hypothetical protein BDK51DRAFT_48640 [Blyttiomyces helicus]|uniref:F-box domain-containing protein n=1 Tax=Blyttiomyces helicus TaxID=388810 RepID=A0A4P9WC27_9FUNG|nr:hypothetical protein BDK51DRAFT_48640 [Blyttiomyces helicus]|eukprot:RKO90054.1 hypothetical protein BDK51DRAFT_48640 [Blyttiomyces helicus]
MTSAPSERRVKYTKAANPLQQQLTQNILLELIVARSRRPIARKGHGGKSDDLCLDIANGRECSPTELSRRTGSTSGKPRGTPKTCSGGGRRRGAGGARRSVPRSRDATTTSWSGWARWKGAALEGHRDWLLVRGREIRGGRDAKDAKASPPMYLQSMSGLEDGVSSNRGVFGDGLSLNHAARPHPEKEPRYRKQLVNAAAAQIEVVDSELYDGPPTPLLPLASSLRHPVPTPIVRSRVLPPSHNGDIAPAHEATIKKNFLGESLLEGMRRLKVLHMPIICGAGRQSKQWIMPSDYERHFDMEDLVAACPNISTLFGGFLNDTTLAFFSQKSFPLLRIDLRGSCITVSTLYALKSYRPLTVLSLGGDPLFGSTDSFSPDQITTIDSALVAILTRHGSTLDIIALDFPSFLLSANIAVALTSACPRLRKLHLSDHTASAVICFLTRSMTALRTLTVIKKWYSALDYDVPAHIEVNHCATAPPVIRGMELQLAGLEGDA